MPRASVVDQLPFMANLSMGLMARFTYLSNNTSLTNSKVLNKFRKVFSKSFPDIPPSLDKSTQIEDIQSQAVEICDTLFDFYRTMVDIAEYSLITKDLLSNVGADMKGIEFKMHKALVSDIFSLFTGYIKCQILVWNPLKHSTNTNSIEIKGLIGLYSYAYSIVHQNNIQSIEKIQEKHQLLISYIQQHQENALHALQSTFHGKLIRNLTSILLSTKEAYEKCRDPTVLRNVEGAFNPEIALLGKLPAPKLYPDMRYCDQILEWVVYTVVVTHPEEHSAKLLEFYQIAASDSYVVPIFREVSLSFHELLEGKIFSDTQRTALVSAKGLHHERKLYVKWALQNVLRICDNNVMTLAPLLPMILGAQSICKSEIKWYMMHESTIHSSKTRNRLVDSHSVAELIHLLNASTELIKVNYKIIKAYYTKYVVTNHASKMTSYVTQYETDPTLDERVKEILKSIPIKLRGITEEEDSDLHYIRRNWTRVAIYFLCSDVPMDLEMDSRMNVICQHSLYIDSLGTVLNDHGSLQSLWYLRDSVSKVLCDSLLTVPFTSVAILQTCRSFSIVPFPDLCPEDQLLIQKELMPFVQSLVDVMMKSVASLVDAVLKHFEVLDAELLESRKPTTSLPGSESRYGSTKAIEKLSDNLTQLSLFLTTILRTNNVKFKIYDTSFNLRQLALSQITLELQRLLRSHGSTTSFTKSRRVYQAVQRFMHHIINPCQLVMVRKTLLSECTTGNYFKDSKTTADLSSKFTDSTFSDLCIREFVNTLEGMPPRKKLGNGFIISSAYDGCFIKKTGDSIESFSLSSSSSQEYRLVMDAKELASLCTVVGSKGFSTLNLAIASQIAAHVCELKTLLVSERDHFLLTDGSTLTLSAIKKIQSLDEITTKLIKIGNAMQLQSFLQKALSDCTQQNLPVVHTGVDTAIELMRTLNQSNKDVEELAYGCGHESIDFDLHTVDALRKENDDIWKVLPVAVAACFSSRVWRQAKYISKIQAFDNNAHTIGIAVQGLLKIMNPKIPMLGGGGDDSTIVSDYQRALRYVVQLSAAVIIAIQVEGKTSKITLGSNTNTTGVADSMIIFLSQFIKMTPEIDENYAQQVLPHSLVHSSLMNLTISSISSDSALSQVLFPAKSKK